MLTAAAVLPAAAGLVAGCQAQSTQTTYGAVPASQPIALNARKAQVGSLVPSSAPATQLSASDRNALTKAINRYRINKGQKPGPVQRALADLDGDGKVEAVVLYTGEGWCAETGCSLTVFTPGPQGFVPVSTTRRVKGPILLDERGSNGWQNIHVKTGGGSYGARFVTLRFSGRGYPGNAITQTTLPADVTPPGRLLIAAAAVSPQTAVSSQTAPQPSATPATAQ